MICFSYKNGPTLGPPYHFTKEEIQRYFTSLFSILSIKEVSIANTLRFKYHFYVCFMEKREK